MKEQLSILANSVNPILMLVGIIFVLTSGVLYVFPPKKINNFYGYRTTSSMKNQETWNFSQRFSAVLMFRVGLAMMVFSCINFVFPMSQKTNLIVGLILVLFGCVLLLWSTEKNIKKKFPNA